MSFKHLSPAERHVVAKQGGIASQRSGKANKWNSETAAAAGAKGGRQTVANKGAEHMKKIGSLGGNARAKNAKPMEPNK